MLGSKKKIIQTVSWFEDKFVLLEYKSMKSKHQSS